MGGYRGGASPGSTHSSAAVLPSQRACSATSGGDLSLPLNQWEHQAVVEELPLLRYWMLVVWLQLFLELIYVCVCFISKAPIKQKGGRM